MPLETCVNSAISAIEAERGGADRVELCENMAEGGCTPSQGSVCFARSRLKIDLFVMIRPRGGDFCYSPDEFEIMQEDIRMVRESGADGVVFGILDREGNIDKTRMKLLRALARPMQVTCHKAFDMTADPMKAMEDLIECGFDRILTSGQQATALEGAPLINALIRQAAGRIIIMPGGGLRPHNLREVMIATGAREFHAYITKVVDSSMTFKRAGISSEMSGDHMSRTSIADAEMIRKMKEIMLTNH